MGVACTLALGVEVCIGASGVVVSGIQVSLEELLLAWAYIGAFGGLA